MSLFDKSSGTGQDPEDDFLLWYEDGSSDLAYLPTPLQKPLEGSVVQEQMEPILPSTAGELTFFDAALEETNWVGSPFFQLHEPSLAEEATNERLDHAVENAISLPFESAATLPRPHTTLPDLIDSPYSPLAMPSPLPCQELPDNFLSIGNPRELDDMPECHANFHYENNVKSPLIAGHHEIDVHQKHNGYQYDAGYKDNAGHQNGGDVVSNHALHHQNEQNDEQNSIKSGKENSKDNATRSDNASEHQKEKDTFLDKASGSNARQDAVPSLNEANNKASSKVSNNRNEELKLAVTEADKIVDEEEFRWIMQRPPPKEKRKDPGNHGQNKNQNPWTTQEEETVKRIVKSMVIVNPEKWYIQVTGGEKRWDIIEDIIRPMGMNRTWSAIKSQWNRTLRESSGIDERRRARTVAMTTGSQPNQHRNEKAKKRKLLTNGEAGIEAEDPKSKKQRTKAKQGDRNLESNMSAPKGKHAQAMGDDGQSQPHDDLASEKKRTSSNKGSLTYEDGASSLAQVYARNQGYPEEISQSTFMTTTIERQSPSPTTIPVLTQHSQNDEVGAADSHHSSILTQSRGGESPFYLQTQPATEYQPSVFQDFQDFQNGGQYITSRGPGFSYFPSQHYGGGAWNSQTGVRQRYQEYGQDSRRKQASQTTGQGRARHRQPSPVVDPEIQARFPTILGTTQGHYQDDGQRESSLSPLPARHQGKEQERAIGKHIPAKPNGNQSSAYPGLPILTNYTIGGMSLAAFLDTPTPLLAQTYDNQLTQASIDWMIDMQHYQY